MNSSVLPDGQIAVPQDTQSSICGWSSHASDNELSSKMGALLIICETATLLGSRGSTCIPEFSTFNNRKCYEPVPLTDYALVGLHLNRGPSHLRYHPSHHFKTFLMS